MTEIRYFFGFKIHIIGLRLIRAYRPCTLTTRPPSPTPISSFSPSFLFSFAFISFLFCLSHSFIPSSYFSSFHHHHHFLPHQHHHSLKPQPNPRSHNPERLVPDARGNFTSTLFFRRGLRAEAKAITIPRRGGRGKGAHRLIRTQVAPLSLTCCSDRQVTLMSRWGMAAKKRNRHGRKGRR